MDVFFIYQRLNGYGEIMILRNWKGPLLTESYVALMHLDSSRRSPIDDYLVMADNRRIRLDIYFAANFNPKGSEGRVLI